MREVVAEIKAQTDVFDTDKVGYPFDVIDDVRDRRGLPRRRHEVRNRHHPDDAARSGNGLDRVVREVSWVVAQRPAVRVGGDDWTVGELDGIPKPGRVEVGEVDSDAEVLKPIDQLDPEVRDPARRTRGSRRVKTPVPDRVAAAMGQRHQP